MDPAVVCIQTMKWMMSLPALCPGSKLRSCFVDYALHPKSYPLSDCYAVLKWFSANAKEYGVDKTRIAVAGGSAGGGLTIASLLARDRQGPEIAFQMPLCPTIDDRHITPSSTEIRTKVLELEANIFAGHI